MLTLKAGHPTVLEIFLFGIGGTLPFTVMNAAVTRGFRVRVAEEPPIVLAFGSSLGVVSVTGTIGVAALAGWLFSGWVAWLIGSSAASLGYLLLTAVEMVLARVLRAVVGPEELEER